MAKSKVMICPYCGETQPAGERCRACGGLFEPLSRRATHNAMGPWFIRDPNRPFQPGCSYETLTRMVQRGQITKLTLIRGPTTKQFWTIARHVPGVAHLLGYCHQCDAEVDPGDHGCHACGAPFTAVVDRNYMGLPELRPLPWEADQNAEPGTAESSALSASRAARTGPRELSDAPRGGRLSSFATDEELLGPGDVDDQAWGGPVPDSGEAEDDADAPDARTEPATATTATAEPDPKPSAAAETKPARSAVVEESMLHLTRKRVLQLQATTQRLWIAVGICIAIIVVLASIMTFPRTPEAQPATTAGDTATGSAQPAAQDDKAKRNAGDATSSQQNKSDDTADVQPSGNEPSAATSATDDAGDESEDDAEADDAPGPYEALLAEAENLLAAARDETRELADRIADYEAALKRLNDVRINAPVSQRPADIAERIKQTERELERLRLREFFP